MEKAPDHLACVQQSSKDPILADKDWIASIVKAGERQPQKRDHKLIQRVPQILRETSKDSPNNNFNPKLVSIGPYHHDAKNTRLQRLQNLKPRLAFKFMKYHKRDPSLRLQELHKKLSNNITLWREYYEEKSTVEYEDDAFIRLLLIDGCFILYFISCLVKRQDPKSNPLEMRNHNTMDSLDMKNHEEAMVMQDLFLLENQIPFPVLQELMPTKDYIKKIDEFLELFINEPPAQQQPPPSHLLELLHQRLVGKMTPPEEKSYHTCCDVEEQETTPTPEANQKTYHTFRNVEELNASGIYLKKSKTKCLSDIKYNERWNFGYLELPEITVDDSTKAKFLNLIAYEMCLDVPDDALVSSYVCFLDSLIDNPNDVKQLRSENILRNCLGSDQEVAQLFNEIGNEIVPNPNAYSKVKRDIQRHYKNKGKVFTAQFKHKYFHNPWSILALVGALLALLFSGIQAHFQIWPLQGDCDRVCQHIRAIRRF